LPFGLLATTALGLAAFATGLALGADFDFTALAGVAFFDVAINVKFLIKLKQKKVVTI
jgi:hypothetical protein